VKTLPPRLPKADDDAPPVDVVIALDVLGYFEDPASALRQALSRLRPGGQVIATAPDHRRYRMTNPIRRSGAQPVPRSWEEHGVHPTSAGVLRRWLRAAGCDGVQVDHRIARRWEPFGLGGARARIVGNSLVASATYADRVAAARADRRASMP
jgi:2-polyprenyl-3-methyl-5-hydroxy-6-metoxy-1,4-benzoquinol methylase